MQATICICVIYLHVNGVHMFIMLTYVNCVGVLSSRAVYKLTCVSSWKC